MEKEKIDWLSDVLSSGPEPGKENGRTPELESWLHEQPDNGRLYDTLRRIEVAPRIQEYAGQMRDRIWLELNERIDRASRRVFWIRNVAAAAAVLFLLLVSNYFSYREGYKSQNSQFVSLENPRGMRSSITLSDGTKVTLNGGTVLTYPTAFVADEREVEVKGEAFFEVEHDGEHPFIVKAGEVRVRVLGTKFNVKAYDEEENIEVVLTEGKIGIGLDADKPVIRMEPEQLVRFDKTSLTFAKQQVDLNLYTSWIDGKFYFSSMTLQEITRQLERCFNVHIHIGSERLKDMVFTGDFVRGENLEQILRVMTFDERIRYSIEGDQIYIKEKE